MKLTKRRIVAFQKFIFDWWEDNRRDLPWRNTHDPYKILVSEVMLQQTQVSRVLPKYEEFLYFFPDVYALAHASPAHVLKVWKGMGYNRRALYLHKTAKMVVETYKGEFPKTQSELSELPGLGTYTARAILVFAYKQDLAMVDTNIRKIITHFFFDDAPQKEAVVERIADQLVPADKSWEWHQALMDYGALRLGALVPKRSRTVSTTPFKETNRYFRGRVIDLLRERAFDERQLVTRLRKEYGKSEDFFDALIASLIRDGLVTRTKKILSLPEA